MGNRSRRAKYIAFVTVLGPIYAVLILYGILGLLVEDAIDWIYNTERRLRHEVKMPVASPSRPRGTETP